MKNLKQYLFMLGLISAALGFCLSLAHAQVKPEPMDLCVKPAKGIIDTQKPEDKASSQTPGPTRTVSPGKAAPDFEASAFVDGGFKNVRLSDYKGKWVVLCFYPGDFTFV